MNDGARSLRKIDRIAEEVKRGIAPTADDMRKEVLLAVERYAMHHTDVEKQEVVGWLRLYGFAVAFEEVGKLRVAVMGATERPRFEAGPAGAEGGEGGGE